VKIPNLWFTLPASKQLGLKVDLQDSVAKVQCMMRFELSLNKMKVILERIGEDKIDLSVIFAWAAVFSFLSIFRYVSFYGAESHFIYIDNVKLVRPYSSFEGPSFRDLDLVIFLFGGLIGGLALRDFEKILFGLAKALFLSLLTGVTYASFYIWFILGFKEFAEVNFLVAFEFTVFYAFLNFARMLPISLIPCMVGAIIAGFLMGTA